MKRLKKQAVIFFVVVLIIVFIAGAMVSYLVLIKQISQLENQASTPTRVLGVYFSPKGGCEEQIIDWINKANSSIHILIYSFTLDSISHALINAQDKGIDVKVVFETTQINRFSEYHTLKATGIEVRNDTNSRLMHNKIMIIDTLMVVTGSFNWSNNANESNNENLIVIRSQTIAYDYEREFTKIWSVSV